MNKETYHRVKNAYLLTINGCGEDCFNCEREICLCDYESVKADAARWIKQKQVERDFYAANKEKRNNAVKARYKKHLAVKNPHGRRVVLNDLLELLPDIFDYEMAMQLWQCEYECARQRLYIFRENGLIEKLNCKRQSSRAYFKKVERK